MPLWFVRGLRRGVVTTRYPARPDPSATGLPTPPAFRPEVLTRELADTLVALCPSHALAREDDTLFFDAGARTACGQCRAAAPAAVAGSGEFELAVTSRTALRRHIPLDGEESR